ncbi:MAG: nucleotidyl transferase AbiEii/AbiGii toxin family protein [Spirochaetales bacterium]
MKNAMHLKAIIKNIANKKHISAQLFLQNYMMERLLERISVSKYHDNFILKGGFLIAAMVGLDTRATMDMDATVKGLKVTKEHIFDMFKKICNIQLNDDIIFAVLNISAIREADDYEGFRVSLSANYPPMAVPLKVDITTGDKITPHEMKFSYKLLLEERSISILAYNLETILAEKLETVISRGDQNTRPRDYYDIYILTKLQSLNIEIQLLKAALLATAEKRGSKSIIKDYKKIIDIVKNSEIMQKQWNNYQKTFEYASKINFEDACETIERLLDRIK